MKTIHQWLSEYGESHRNHTNKLIHWVCVPTIFFSITGLLYSVKFPLAFYPDHKLNLAIIVMAVVILYYMLLSRSLWIGMSLFGLACLFICHWIERSFTTPLWLVCIVLFVLAWIGQFYGHKIEGKKPSFLKDLQFLMIGPAWLMSFIYQKLHIRY